MGKKSKAAPKRYLGSPFADVGRFEYQSDHFYFFTPEELEQIETHKSCLVLGTRGTGKTTWLKSLDWSERVNNENLEKCIREAGGSLFGRKTIGVYTKMPQHRVHLFETARLAEMRNAPEQTIEHRLGELYSSFLGLICAELLLDAIPSLRSKHIPDFSAESESNLANEIANIVLGETHNGSLLLLKTRVISRRTKLEQALEGRDSPLSRAGDLISGPVRGLGSLLSGIAKSVCDFLDKGSPRSGNRWSIRFLLDEAESIEYSWHRRVMNSLIRVSQFPLFYSIAIATAELSTANTIYAGYDISGADVRIVPLGVPVGTRGRGERVFRAALLGVVAQRLATAVASEKGTPQPSLGQLVEMLGRSPLLKTQYGLNEILELHIQQNRKSRFTYPSWIQNAEHEAEVGGSLPKYWEWYLIEKLELNIRSTDLIERKMSNEIFRKKSAFAYLSICHEMSWVPLYAGFERVLDIADYTIRDGILAFDQIWKVLKPASVAEFTSHNFTIEEYSSALQSVGNLKMLILPAETGSEESATRLLKRLCEHISFKQSELSSIKSPEVGMIRVSKGSNEDEIRDASALLLILSSSGYIRDFSNSAKFLQFRLSRTLAAKFRFTWRVPTYSTVLSAADIVSFANGGSLKSVKRKIEKESLAHPELVFEEEL
jgi:hypothetical protein